MLSLVKIPTLPIRQILYFVGAVLGLGVPLLVQLHVIDPAVGEQILKVVALFGGGVAGVAGAVLGQQKSDGTLVFKGSAEEQAIAAAQAVADQYAAAGAAVERVRAAVTPALGPLAQAALDALGTANTADAAAAAAALDRRAAMAFVGNPLR